MFNRFLVLISTAALLVSCAESSGTYNQLTDGEFGESTGIIGGKDAAERSPLTNRTLSFTVDIPPTPKKGGVVEPAKGFQCSAVAITKRVILTAAHCWHSDPRAYYSVQVPDESGRQVEIGVVDSEVNTLYRFGRRDYDLALFLLEKDLPSNIEIARLPEYRDQIKPLYINAAGFGKSIGMKSSTIGVGVLRIVTLRVRNYDINQMTFEVDQRQGKGICQGDSGGPAYAEFQGKTYLVGIVSRSRGIEQSDNDDRDLCDEAGIFTKVDSNLQWIKVSAAILDSSRI